jgi:beta-galactosidase GanA
MTKFLSSVLLLLCSAVSILTAQEPLPNLLRLQDELPYLRDQGTAIQLLVDGEPLLLRAGELGNSSASNLDYMAEIWPKLAELNLNAVLAPVYWELIEPEEGEFDFVLVDGLIDQAREYDMRLVFLWFGSWKNSMSSYVPAWVKRDQDRFPRAQQSDGTGLEILTPFDDANVEADARAFEALMRHLRDYDAEHHTVVMVQVENEIGMIPEARDHSPAAEAAFRDDVPSALLEYLDSHRASLHPSLAEHWKSSDFATTGSWTDVFGEGPHTDEIFMAWQFARYVERVAAAGKALYPLPMYVNAALIRPNYLPGQYPSAGPLPHLIDVWRAGSESIDFLAPDIYFPNFVEWLGAYDVPDNAVFIPEAGRASHAVLAANALYAVATHNAMGYSPFSIENAPENTPLSEAYDVLRQLEPLIVRHQGRNTIKGFLPPVSFDGTIDESPQEVQLGDYRIKASFVYPWVPREDQEIDSHGGLIIALADNTFLVAGTGLTLRFTPIGPGEPIAGIEHYEEGRFVDGMWQRGRVLNGDQSHQGRQIQLPPGEMNIQRFSLYRYR